MNSLVSRLKDLAESARGKRGWWGLGAYYRGKAQAYEDAAFLVENEMHLR